MLTMLLSFPVRDGIMLKWVNFFHEMEEHYMQEGSFLTHAAFISLGVYS